MDILGRYEYHDDEKNSHKYWSVRELEGSDGWYEYDNLKHRAANLKKKKEYKTALEEWLEVE